MQAEAPSLDTSPLPRGEALIPPISLPPLCTWAQLVPGGPSWTDHLLWDKAVAHCPCSTGGSGAPGPARVKPSGSSCHPALPDNPFCTSSQACPTHSYGEVHLGFIRVTSLKGSEVPVVIYELCILTGLLQVFLPALSHGSWRWVLVAQGDPMGCSGRVGDGGGIAVSWQSASCTAKLMCCP